MLQSWKHTVFSNSQPSQTWWIQQFKLTEHMTRRLEYEHPSEEVLIWERVMGWEIPLAQGRLRDSFVGSQAGGGGGGAG